MHYAVHSIQPSLQRITTLCCDDLRAFYVTRCHIYDLVISQA